MKHKLPTHGADKGRPRASIRGIGKGPKQQSSKLNFTRTGQHVGCAMLAKLFGPKGEES